MTEDLITVHEVTAREILNTSKQYTSKLLDEGVIPYTGLAPNRRILYIDVLSYKVHRDSERSKGLEELSRFIQEEGFYDE